MCLKNFPLFKNNKVITLTIKAMYYKLILCLLLFSQVLYAQDDATADSFSPINRAVKATEFAIPSSPAFNLLNNNTPSRIERYTTLHNLKVDWSLTNGQAGYAISPGLGMEVQPVWLLFFDRAAVAKYRRASPLVRTLSTLSLSAGTNASLSKNWLAWAAKLNLYRQHDPLDDAKFLREVEKTTKAAQDTFRLKIKDFNKRRAGLNQRAKNYGQRRDALTDSIAEMRFEMRKLDREQSQKLSDVREQYLERHWNASYLDIAFGRLLTYEQTQSIIHKTFESLTVPGLVDTVSFVTQSVLRLDKQGYGAWLSGGLGLGSHAIVSGMLRYAKKPSSLVDTVGRQISIGANIRYGSHRYNFFIEAFYDQETYPLKEAPGLTLRQNFSMVTLGGDWRISHNVMLSFGIRQLKDFDTGTFTLQPLVNLNCLMR